MKWQKAECLIHFLPLEIRQKLQEAGISEAEALKFAEENNLDITKFTSPKTSGQAQTQSTQPASGGVIVQIAPTISNTDSSLKQGLSRDTTTIPKGTHGLDYFGYEIFKNIPAAF